MTISPAIIAFGVYLSLGCVFLMLFTAMYMRFTRHDELALMRQGNLAATLALGGSMAGFSVPLSRSIMQAGSVADMMLWAGLALIVQLLAYGVARFLLPDLSRRVADGDMAAATLVAVISVIAGILNASSMTLV